MCYLAVFILQVERGWCVVISTLPHPIWAGMGLIWLELLLVFKYFLELGDWGGWHRGGDVCSVVVLLPRGMSTSTWS